MKIHEMGTICTPLATLDKSGQITVCPSCHPMTAGLGHQASYGPAITFKIAQHHSTLVSAQAQYCQIKSLFSRSKRLFN